MPDWSPLQDEDRIFKNLYGYHSWNLESAKKRGAWDNTKALIDLGRDKIVEIVKASGLRGRGRVPDRPEMVVHAQGNVGQTVLFGREC